MSTIAPLNFRFIFTGGEIRCQIQLRAQERLGPALWLHNNYFVFSDTFIHTSAVSSNLFSLFNITQQLKLYALLSCLSVIVTHGNKMFACLKFFFFSLHVFNLDYSFWSWKLRHICKPAEIPKSCMPLWLLHSRYHVCYQLRCCKPLGSVTGGL